MLKKIKKMITQILLAAFVSMSMLTNVLAAGAAPDPFATEVTFENGAGRGSVELIKYKTDKKTVLPDVTFKLQSLDGTIVKELTTGADGRVVFTDLASGRYTVTETKTVNGYTLLKDPIEVSIPFTVEEQKAIADGLDVTKAVLYNGSYHYYDLKYEVADDTTFVIPMTGFFDHWTNYVGLIAALVLIGGGFFLAAKRKVFVKN